MKNKSEVLLDIEDMKTFMKDCVNRFYHRQEMDRKNYQKIEIKTCENNPIGSEIYISGQKIEGVRAFELTQKAGDLPRLRLDINALNLSIDQKCVCTAEGWGDFAIRLINPASEDMES